MTNNFSNIDNTIDKNLEFVKVKKELSDDSNFKYTEFLNIKKPSYFLTYINIVTIYLIFLTFLFINTHLYNSYNSFYFKIIFFILNSFCVGLAIHNIQQALHVGLHYELHKNKKINDCITYFLGLLTGVDVKQARIIHMKHHIRHAEEDDPENSYLYPMTLLKIIKFFSGISIAEYCFKIDQKTSIQNENFENKNKKILKKILVFFTFSRFLSITLHLLIFLYLYKKSNLLFALSWVYGFLTFFPFFASLLNILEHGEEKLKRKSDQKTNRAINRLFDTNFFSKYIFAPFGAHKHAIHHWDPTVHHTIMDSVENFLLKTQVGNCIKNRKTTLFKTLKEIF
jgi:fatty acid desaturase